MSMSDINNTKSKRTVEIVCSNCNNSFLIYKSLAQAGRKYCSAKCKKEHLTLVSKCRYCGIEKCTPRTHRFVYCSRKCNALHREALYTKTFECTGCTKPVKRIQSYLKSDRSGANQYCSVECYHKHKITHPRSKNETLFFERIKQVYPDAKANVRINNREADILIESLGVAIHWNGPTHYKPIYGDDALSKTQQRDRERYEIFKARGYHNYIIIDEGGYSCAKVDLEFGRFIKEKSLQSPRGSLWTSQVLKS